MNTPASTPVVSIVGKKNGGKTTLIVALAAELKRRGYRVATVKHGHHEFDFDQPGRDSWRHFHDGEAEAVLLVSSAKLALVMRTSTEIEPEMLIEQFLQGRGYDIILAEGYKYGPFPKIEVFRPSQHQRPVYDPNDAAAADLFLAIATDDPLFRAACPVVKLDREDAAGSHVAEIADLVEAHMRRS